MALTNQTLGTQPHTQPQALPAALTPAPSMHNSADMARNSQSGPRQVPPPLLSVSSIVVGILVGMMDGF